MTHDQEEALSISDRVAVLSQGRIEQIGPPAEIYGAPETPFVAEFVGTMNRFEATVADPERGEVDYGGDPARGRRRAGPRAGERCSCSCGPRAWSSSSRRRRASGLTGEILSQTFLGPVTRLKSTSASGELTRRSLGRARRPRCRRDARAAGFPAAQRAAPHARRAKNFPQ